MRLENNPWDKSNSKRKVQQLGTLGHFSFFLPFSPSPFTRGVGIKNIDAEQSYGPGTKARLIYNLQIRCLKFKIMRINGKKWLL